MTANQYATNSDLLLLLPPSSTTRDTSLVTDILVRASAYIDSRCERDFNSHGPETRIVRADYGPTLDVSDGIVALTLVEYATAFGGTWAALGAENTDWYLDWLDGGSYFRVSLPSNGSIASWYSGPRMARLTGTFGFPAVPELIRGGTLALAREMFAALPGRPGAGEVDADGIPRWLPAETYQAIKWGRALGRVMMRVVG